VDHRSLAARGLERDPARYQAGDKGDEARTQDYRQQLRDSGVTSFEALHTYGAWQDQKKSLLGTEREYIKDLCRDHLWRYDRSPARERAQSMERTLTHAMEHQRTTDRERTPARESVRELKELVAALAQRGREDEMVHGGLQVRLHDKDQGHERDLSM